MPLMRVTGTTCYSEPLTSVCATLFAQADFTDQAATGFAKGAYGPFQMHESRSLRKEQLQRLPRGHMDLVRMHKSSMRTRAAPGR